MLTVLHRMQENGWIKIALGGDGNGRKRKYYSIKKDGRQALKEKREQWAVISSVLSGLWKGQHVNLDRAITDALRNHLGPTRSSPSGIHFIGGGSQNLTKSEFELLRD